jgi:hypothetical protein
VSVAFPVPDDGVGVTTGVMTGCGVGAAFDDGVGVTIGAAAGEVLWLALVMAAAPMPAAAAPAAAGASTDAGIAAVPATALEPIDAVNGVAAVACVVNPVPAKACVAAAAPPAAVTTPVRLMKSVSPLVSANVCVPTVTTTSPFAHSKHDTTSPCGPVA